MLALTSSVWTLAWARFNGLMLNLAVLLGHCYRDFGTCYHLVPILFLSAEAYRRAVDVSPRDYRAWYGLGQTYELLKMPYFALYYFRRCALSTALPCVCGQSNRLQACTRRHAVHRLNLCTQAALYRQMASEIV